MAQNDPAHSFLVEWTVHFLKNKDILLRNIESIEQDKKGYDIYIKYKDKEQNFVVTPLLEPQVLSKFNEDGHFGLVTANTKANFDFLIKNWKSIIKFKRLCIYFVNPFSQLDKRWIICPYTHHSICDDSALEKGLKSMFEMVDLLTEQQIKDRFK